MPFTASVRRFARPALVLALLAVPLCSGCGVFTSVLKIHPDGSGTIVQTTKLNAMATQLMTSMATMGDSTNQQADSSSRLFTKKKVRARAARFGEGVRFVRMERLQEGGYRAVYAFDDVRTVRLMPKRQMDLGNDGPGEKASGEKTAHAGTKTSITFDFTPGPAATLAMHLGGPADPGDFVEMNRGGKNVPGENASGDTSNTAGQMRMARMMLQDAKMGVAVEPQGTLVETDAAHRSENGRVTLMELNFSELMADPQAFERFMKAEDEDLTGEETQKMIRALPGVRVETQETVTMRFK